MKKTILLSFLFFIQTKSHAQFVFTAASTNPIPGDYFSTITAISTNVLPGPSGANQTWDFSNLVIDTTIYLYYYLAPAIPKAGCDSSATNLKDSVVIANTANNYPGIGYFASTNDSLKQFSGYNSGFYTLFTYPFSFGDSTQNTYSMNAPCQYSSFYQQTGSGTFKNKYDAYGTLILPGGVTYTNAARIYTQKHFSYSSQNTNISSNTWGVEQTYQWYISGNKFPVLSIDFYQDTVNCYSFHCTQPYFYNYSATVTLGKFNGVGIKQINKNFQIKIYPNPAQNKITIDATDVVDVKLFDVLGKQIFTTKEKNIDVNSLPEGVYFIQVQTNTGTTTQKIIVQH